MVSQYLSKVPDSYPSPKKFINWVPLGLQRWFLQTSGYDESASMSLQEVLFASLNYGTLKHCCVPGQEIRFRRA